MKRYTTFDDVITYEIRPSLGDDVDDFDMDAIAEATYEFRVDHDEHGNELLNTAGYEQVVDVDEYWSIVESCVR